MQSLERWELPTAFERETTRSELQQQWQGVYWYGDTTEPDWFIG